MKNVIRILKKELREWVRELEDDEWILSLASPNDAELIKACEKSVAESQSRVDELKKAIEILTR